MENVLGSNPGVFGGSFIIPILVAVALLAFLAGLMIWAKRYIKVSPDEVAVITGRKRKIKDADKERVVGYRQVRGGATFVWPLLEQVQYLNLKLMTIQVAIQKAYNKDGVPVTVDAVANVKIKGEDSAIANAVERFLGKPDQIETTVRETLEGHLRSIVGGMTIEELNSNRKAFAQKLLEESVSDLEKMGIGVDSVVIKRIADEHGYLDALGIQRTAEVKRDAEVGKANAEAEAKKKTTDAQRDAAETANLNMAKIAESTKKLEVQKAAYSAEVAKEQATAAQAGPRATAEANKAVLVAQEDAKAAQTAAAANVQVEEAGRRAKELEATIIRQAEADKQKTVIDAEAAKQKAVIDAEAAAAVKVRAAQAELEAANKEAEADATRIRAKGQAEADAVKAKLLAEADGEKAKLVAEAEGKERLAEALKKLNDAGQLLFLMEKSPDVIKALGDAGGEIARGIFQSLASPLGSIDNLSVYDAGRGADGKGAMDRLAGVVPNMFFDFLKQSQANGVELGTLAETLVKALTKKLSASAGGDSAAPVSGQTEVAAAG